MNVSLTPTLEKLIDEKVASGMYSSASEVIREALRLLDERDQDRTAELQRLRAEIARGIAQADSGKNVKSDPEKIKQRVRNSASRRNRAS